MVGRRLGPTMHPPGKLLDSVLVDGLQSTLTTTGRATHGQNRWLQGEQFANLVRSERTGQG